MGCDMDLSCSRRILAELVFTRFGTHKYFRIWEQFAQRHHLIVDERSELICDRQNQIVFRRLRRCSLTADLEYRRTGSVRELVIIDKVMLAIVQRVEWNI